MARFTAAMAAPGRALIGACVKVNIVNSNILPIWATAALVLRRLWRTGIWLMLAVLLTAGICGLRLAIQGDGTLTGMARIWLSYSIAWVSFLLSAATLIIGASAISLENATGRLQLVRVKPVAAAQIWIGNWLGLSLVNAALLGLAGAALGIGMWRFNCGASQPAAELTALRNTLLTAQVSLPAAVLTDQPDSGAAGVTVPPGGAGRWRINLPDTMLKNRPGGLQFEFITAQPDQTAAIPMVWMVGLPGAPHPRRFEISVPPRKPHRLDLPADLLQPGRALEITCANQHPETTTTLLFPGQQGLILLAPAGSFAGNLLRAGLIIFARLAFLAALGLTAGAAFSFPVALLLAGAMPLLDTLNRFRYAAGRQWVRWAFQGDASAWPIRMLDLAVAAASEIVRLLMPALGRFDPVGMLTGGRLIPWAAAGQAGIVLCFYAALLAGAGAWLLARRQLGMAGT